MGRVCRAVGVVVGVGDGASTVGLSRLFGVMGTLNTSVDQLPYGAGSLLLVFRAVDGPLWAEKVVVFVVVDGWPEI